MQYINRYSAILIVFLIMANLLFAQTTIIIKRDTLTIKRDTLNNSIKEARSRSVQTKALIQANKTKVAQVNALHLQQLAKQSFEPYKAYPARVTGFGSKISIDTIDVSKLKSKSISIETTCAPNATVFIENVYRTIHIKTSTDNKVKITTTIYYEKELSLTDSIWFKKMNLEMRGNANQVLIKGGASNFNSINTITLNSIGAATDNTNRLTELTQTLNNAKAEPTTIILKDSLKRTLNLAQSLNGKTLTIVPNYNFYYKYDFAKEGQSNFRGNQMAIFDGDGNWVNRRSSNLNHVLEISIPSGAKLDIVSKYANVSVEDNIKDLNIIIDNATLVMKDANKAIIESKYGDITTGNIKDASIQIINAKLSASNIEKLAIDSKNSNVEFGVVKTLQIKSVNDEYEIDGVGELIGRKDYGNLHITNLINSFDLTGSNADLRIRNIEPTATFIKMDNKYADVRLAVSSLNNYTVDFTGNSRRINTPFEKQDVEYVPAKKGSDSTKTTTSIKEDGKEKLFTTSSRLTYRTGYAQNNPGDNDISKFKGTVGDTKGKHTEFQLKCNNCAIDFR